MTLRDVVQGSDTKAGRAFDYIVFFLIISSIIALTFETWPDLSPAAKRAFHIFEVVTVVLFTIEYVLRIATSPEKRRYIFSFHGIIDLVVILPFYLSLGFGFFAGFDLRAARALRLFRIFRILKIARYNRAMARFGKAISEAKEEVLIFLFAAIMLLYLSAVGIYYFEREVQPEDFGSIIHSLWWALITLTTVGYGDAFPVTMGGKLFTFVILICGLGVVAIPAGIVSSALSRVVRNEDQKEE